MSATPVFVIGTRASPLAIGQAEIVARLLRDANPGAEFRLEPITTRADYFTDRPVSAIGDKGVFVRPIQDALLAGAVDIAVHSLKDIPADVEVPGLTLAAFPERADPRDVFVSNMTSGFEHLPAGIRIGTSSPRRRWLMGTIRPDYQIVPIRGNVQTRLRKLDEGEFDGLLLAAAGLLRLGHSHRIQHYLDPQSFVPGAGQGTLAVETCATGVAHDVVARIDDPLVRATAIAERALVRRMGAGCDSPVGAYAVVDGGILRLRAVAPAAGRETSAVVTVCGDLDRAEWLGDMLGAQLFNATQ